jgi:hypothetical protein
MKNFKTDRLKIVIASVLVAMTFCFHGAFAQENESISIYQYRKVDNDKVNEFIERETKYWSKVAQKAIDDGKLGFWGLFQKVGGYDMPNSSNFLFINTFQDLPDMDEMGGVWDAQAVFPDVPMEDMETYSMGINTSMIFVKPMGWAEAEGVNAVEDFKYVTMVYHNANDPAGLITAENEVWAPFIKTAMDEGKTAQKAWGNARILSPTGEDIKYNTISFDIYPSLKDALDQTWSGDLQTPDMTKIGEAEGNRRASVVYRIVHVVNSNQ